MEYYLEGGVAMGQNYTKSRGSRRGRKQYQPDPKRLLFNVDTLWYTFDAENYDGVMGDMLNPDEAKRHGLSERLERGKAVAEGVTLKDYIQVKLERYENPFIFEIQAGGQAPVYGYHIRNEDMAIYFARRRRNDETFPIKIQINQLKLWELGVRDAYEESLDVLAKLGFIFTASKPSRIDLCVHSDQWRWNYEDFEHFEYPRNFSQDNHPTFVKLDKKTGEFGTVYFGDRTRLQLRIYNKSKEVEDQQKYYFRELYDKHGMDVNGVWNHEFEVHRSYLRDFADESTGQMRVFDSMDWLLYEGGLSMLWTHLVNKFTHDSAFWKVLQKGDPDKFIQCKNYLFRLKDIDTTEMREVAQIRGRLQKLVLKENIPKGSDMKMEAIKRFCSLCTDYEKYKEKNFESEVYRKRRRYMDIEMLKSELSGILEQKNISQEAEELLKSFNIQFLNKIEKIKTPAEHGSQTGVEKGK
jgi:hypothetical protein